MPRRQNDGKRRYSCLKWVGDFHTLSLSGIRFFILLFLLFILVSCSVTRHVPKDEEVLSRVHIEVDGHPNTNNSLRMAVAQNAYHRTFGFLPLSTWIWHNDSINAWQRFRRKSGTPPPIYDEALAVRTDNSMQRVLVNQGYLGAKVWHTTEVHDRKVSLTYHVDRGRPHRIRKVTYMVEDPLLEPIVAEIAPNGSLQRGERLDRTQLEAERTRLTSEMRNLGFYDFNKENISFVADTMPDDKRVDLTMMVEGIHNRYTIRHVEFIPDFDLATGQRSGNANYLRHKILTENCYIQPGDLYSEEAVRKTYSAFSRLHILKYVNIRLEPTDKPDELNCTVYLSPQNPQALQFELDGTNTSGDLGFAASLTYQHRNLFRGSEAYSATIKGGYESLSGDLSGLVNDNYTEYSFDNQIDFPRFLFPFISPEKRRSFTATTAVKAGYSYQSRPEYTRIITNAGYSYKWSTPRANLHHTLDVLDLSYVYLPKRSERFLQMLGNAGPLSYSSYTSHLILSSSYNIYAGNGRSMMNMAQNTARDLWSLRFTPEVAGNILDVLSSVAHFQKVDGRYNIFNLPFEQYARADADFSYSRYLTDRSRLAFHLAGGLAVPFGNSTVMPFEKRYYSGGANSVRGWNVRALGPGIYRSDNTTNDYFNQCGDVRLDASVELRSRLFWKFEFATFVDAGNVWTLHPDDAQPGGAFSSDFYREIAASWGLGLRLVTDFVVLRLDMGVKAYDPSLGKGADSWVISEPHKSRNRTIHFAVGYPF